MLRLLITAFAFCCQAQGSPIKQDTFGGAVIYLGDTMASPGGCLVIGDSGLGRAYIVGLPERRLIRRLDSPSGCTGFGFQLFLLGDVDGGGLQDFVVTSVRADSGKSGIAHIYSGESGALLGELSFPLAPRGGAKASVTFCGIGDIDGDGHDEYVFGRPFAKSGAGTVTIMSGKSHLPKSNVDLDRTGLGSSLAAIADVDGDGFNDFAIGCISSDVNEAGCVALCSGKASEVIRIIELSDGARHFGYSVAQGPDVDGDGALDLLVGQPYAYEVPNAFAISCSTGRIVGSWKGHGNTLGVVVSAVGAKLLFGEPVDLPLDAENGVLVVDPQRGGRYLTGELSRSDALVIHECSGVSGYVTDTLWNSHFGVTITPVADVTGDAVLDYAVGAAGGGCLECIGTVSLYDGATDIRVGDIMLRCQFEHSR